MLINGRSVGTQDDTDSNDNYMDIARSYIQLSW